MTRTMPALILLALVAVFRPTGEGGPLRFEIEVAPGLISAPRDGRAFVILGPRSVPEPRFTVGNTGLDAPPVAARDIEGLAPGRPAVIDADCASFPIESLSKLKPGDYYVQAVFDSNIDLRGINAPGNLYSRVQKLSVDPRTSGTVKLTLSMKVPDDEPPADTEYVKFIRLKSELLSKFHGRPIYLRAGVILPKGYDADQTRRYPLRVSIGGYGSRYTEVLGMMRPGSPFSQAWTAPDAPRMLLVRLDGDGPYGDPYQVNSDNNGPYGDALIKELIPFVEQKFRALGKPYARVLEGGSTGGWVSLALQVFYPDYFNGTWSFCPDGVDFRAFQLINIYENANAYVNRHGFERASARDLDGDVRFTVRHECQMENVLGSKDSWTMSGEQWGAWNATYGARGAHGRPRPLWDPKTGEIDRGAVEHWKRYDLRIVLESNWKTLGPKLRGKIHIWVGDADTYFLNNGVHFLDAFLSRAQPAYDGTIVYGPGKGHCWQGISERRVADEMAAAIERTRPK
jgi:Putative esterase